jgi:hypothetical protein
MRHSREGKPTELGSIFTDELVESILRQIVATVQIQGDEVPRIATLTEGSQNLRSKSNTNKSDHIEGPALRTFSSF